MGTAPDLGGHRAEVPGPLSFLSWNHTSATPVGETTSLTSGLMRAQACWAGGNTERDQARGPVCASRGVALTEQQPCSLSAWLCPVSPGLS